MWYEFLATSLPFMLIIFMLLRHINLERNAWCKERAMLVTNLASRSNASNAQSDSSFIPLDDPRLSPLMEHMASQRSSTVSDVEGTEGQPK